MTPYTQYSWTETANGLAQQVRKSHSGVKRGVVPLRFVDDSTAPPHFVDDAPLVVGVFGNDNYLWDEKTRREVEVLRGNLKEIDDITEMAFGLSEDGQTWAMLVATDKDRYHTGPGQIFQKELFKLTLEQAMWHAWRQVTGLPADNALEDGSMRGPAPKRDGF